MEEQASLLPAGGEKPGGAKCLQVAGHAAGAMSLAALLVVVRLARRPSPAPLIEGG